MADKAKMVAEPLVTRWDEDGCATLTLNRPDKRNAINRALFRELREHIVQLSTDDSIGLVVLRGAGNNFSAGHDLKEPSHADALGWLRQEMLTIEQLTRLRQPVIAAVEGICYTGGLELALATDIILCDETARFADTHGKWGMTPTWAPSASFISSMYSSSLRHQLCTTSNPASSMRSTRL